MRNLTNIVLLVAVNAMWAAQYPAYKKASEQVGPVGITLWCLALGALILAPFLAWERRRSGSRRTGWSGQDIRAIVWAGGGGLIPASAFLAWGTERSTASNAALIYFTVPILTAVLAWLMLGERMTRRRWISLGVSIAGVLLLSGAELRSQTLASRSYLTGNLLVLGGCMSSCFYNVYCKGLLERVRPIELLTSTYAAGAVLCLPLLAWAEPHSLRMVAGYSNATWLSIAVLAALSWGAAMVLWMFLLTRLDVSQASLSIYLLPFLGVLVSAVTLGESVTGSMIVGGGFTLAGTVLATANEGAQ
jgi:drug/metabolite transporter (DMT)-like permease